MVPEVTFKYSEQGPIGLLSKQGKKAVHILAAGGNFSGSADHQLGDVYLRKILAFMGITDFDTIFTEMTGVLQNVALENSVNRAVEEAKKAGRNF
jgi:FMN-dependent NADH-azoreductase